MKKRLPVSYQEIISLENLFEAWREFVAGKRRKKDVMEFGLRLADNILQLHGELVSFAYSHGPYEAFNISDPKPRNIHKVCVRDRVLHHAVYIKLYPFFDRTFIADSYSCRVDKGTHKALDRFRSFALRVSRNNTRTSWVLKLDIKKFFASIDHKILLDILASYIPDRNVLQLLGQVILSFPIQSGIRKMNSGYFALQNSGMTKGKGLPLGNLTSQLFCNVYMNEFDQFVKHKLKVRHYIRYVDDFILLSDSQQYLIEQIQPISEFLRQRLGLSLHPNKIFLMTLASGVDFLGWLHFLKHRILRTITGRRMFKKISKHPENDTLQSYLGLLRHGNSFKLRQKLLNLYGLLA